MTLDAPRTVNVPVAVARVDDAILVAMLTETPLKRLGYEHARTGERSVVDRLPRREAVKYEEGRLLYAELASLGKRAPPWVAPRPPTGILKLCRRWMRRYPDGAIVPPSVEAW